MPLLMRLKKTSKKGIFMEEKTVEELEHIVRASCSELAGKLAYRLNNDIINEETAQDLHGIIVNLDALVFQLERK